MRATRVLTSSFNFMGQRVPFVVGLLGGLTFVASLLAAVGGRFGLPLFVLAGLSPDLVWQGQVWRLVTWVFFQPDPIALLFACLMLLWFGSGLCYTWGPKRFLGVFLGFAAGTGVLTCLVGLGWPDVMKGPYLTSWPVDGALVVAWAILFPHRDILMFLLIPMRGRHLIYFTVGFTVVFALYTSFAAFVPHFLAQGLMLLYMREPSLHNLWLRFRLAALERSARRRASHLRPVEKDEWGKPPRWLH